MADLWERLNNNRPLILKLLGNVAALLIALGYITVDQGKGITDSAVLVFALAQLVAGTFIGVVQRKNAVGLETAKKERQRHHERLQDRYGH